MGNTIIGIDLGTSTTEAAVYRNGKTEMIPNPAGEIVTPSVVGINDDGNWVVGERAKAQLLLSPEKTAMEIKRKTGTGEMIRLGDMDYSPLELSAKLLEYVRTYASSYLKEEISRAVISVPAYFNDIQRQETVRAGELAGFQVERILNEPTSAAMSYGIDHMEEESHILVYDLGGGTFDVTLLEMFDGVLEAKASSGDNQLGGKDFDACLIDCFVKEFQKKYNVDLRKDPYACVRLKEEAEKCKMALSEEEEYHVLLPALAVKNGTPLELDLVITVSLFEQMTEHLVKRTHTPIEVVLSDSGLSAEEIDRVILVGGSTRMPMIEKDIQEYLGIVPERAVNPDYAVSEGAAVQAAIIEGKILPEEGLLMTDVNPFTLGIRVFDGMSSRRMSVVIPRNVTIPARREETYSTSSNYQTEAKIEVYQGESDWVDSNHYLGEFTMKGIPPRPAHEEKLLVTFSYDLNGILDVRAKIVSTGKDASIRIEMQKGPRIEEMPDIENWKESPVADRYRMTIRRAERILEKAQDTEKTEYRNLERAVRNLKQAIVMENDGEAAELEKDLKQILKMMS
ncbi:MAG: Hsp70 family protein [Blautia sp.]|nr:Hsp70 family protein [Blautia sp.]